MEDRRWLASQISALHEITKAINAGLSHQEVLDIMLERICVELRYKAATVRLLDEERQELQLRAYYGLSDAYMAKGAVPVAQSGVDQAVLTGQNVILEDVRHDADSRYAEAAVPEGLASMLALPVSFQERIIGVIHIYKGEPHRFSPEEQAFMAVVADLGAQAICRTRRFEALQKLTHNVNSTLELTEVLMALLVESVGALNVRAGSVRLLGPERQTLHLVSAYGLSETYLKKGAVKVAQSPIDRRVLQASQPIAIDDVTQESGFQYPEEARREGIRSVFVLPLRVKDTVIGVMRMYSSQVRRFSAEEVAFALAIADLGAVAIENAKLHQALKQRLEELKEDVNGWYRFLTFG